MIFKMNSITRSIVAVCLIDGVVGLSFGATAGHFGIDLWIPFILAVTVLAGTSEFIFISVLATGGNPIMGALAGLLVNIRHLPFGVLVKHEVGSGWKHLLGSHLMNDESVAFALSQSKPERKKYAYWLSGLGILLCWPIGILIGGVFSDLIINPEQLGLDALFPCLIFALVVPTISTKRKAIQSALGATLATVSTPFLAAGLPAVLALSALFLFPLKSKKKTT
ncbi:AzlC family ABC transporter permease [Marinomonas mediterranea]|uniref:AzlC family ABC transporter permease n=1 Tax=Marinomonas mediterranea TaxID=119864 RepID=UPI0023494290|nr:AzlC family ABC transporter permease [Marinomonas mediterranea]WCN07919.1 branched-chain amino acid ABC transporter permease [Marinomonas mediterranea]WCN12014.1 branched-chain amino acid ABC transporter permease [Marinomonas mediterranea]